MVGRSEYVQSPDRGLAVIRCFDAARPAWRSPTSPARPG